MTNTTQEKQTLVELADNMASAATAFTGHGYSVFIEAREKYVSEVEKILEKVKQK